MPIYSMNMIDACMIVERVMDRRFYIEWLDRHNPREVIKESEAGDE